MNQRQRYSLLKEHLIVAIESDKAIANSLKYSARHAEHLVAAGFGYSCEHDYLEALSQGTELCRGYYAPDTQLIAKRMQSLGYDPALSQAFSWHFTRASCNGDNMLRADLVDDFAGERAYVSRTRDLVNQIMIGDYIKESFLREQSSFRKKFSSFGITNEGEGDENFSFSITFPDDFPSVNHLGETIELPIEVSYDLELGEDIAALHYGRNRRLAYKGRVWLKSSGKRGWDFPTISLDELPFIDQRSARERRGIIDQLPDHNLNQAEFDDGRRCCATNNQHQDLGEWPISWLCGYVATMNGSSIEGDMSVGLVKRALTNAYSLALSLKYNKELSQEIAIRTCRYFAARSTTRDLEDAIKELRS